MLGVIGIVTAILLALGLAHRIYRISTVEWHYARTHRSVSGGLWWLALGYVLAHVTALVVLVPCFGYPLFQHIITNLVFVAAGPPSIAMFLFLAWTCFVEAKQGTVATNRYAATGSRLLYRSWKGLHGLAYGVVLGLALHRVMTTLIVLEHVALIGFTATAVLIRVAAPKARYVLSPRACKMGRALQAMTGQ